MKPEELNCPSCGADLPDKIQTTSLVACEYCDTLVFYENERVKNAGKKGTLVKVPSLINLHEPFKFQNEVFTPVGQLRFDYGQGFWDEFWVLDSKQKGHWVSVDEGDIAIEKPYHPSGKKAEKWYAEKFDNLKVGRLLPIVKAYQVTEKGTATCVAVEGSVPEKMLVGDRFHYAHLQKGTSFMTIEFDIHESGRPSLSAGEWIDPFLVRKL